MKCICSMCEEKVSSLPYKIIDKIPHHKGHTQKICADCNRFINGIANGDVRVIDISEDYQKNPLVLKEDNKK